MRQQLSTMLDLQDSMNTKVNEQWRTQGFAWYRAIWVECAELLDHFGWKWWKKQAPDLAQVQLELIDIWHFGLSQLLVDEKSREALLEDLVQGLAGLGSAQGSEEQFRLAVEAFAGATLNTRKFSVEGFAALMNASGLDFESLYTGYVGKNVLNFFRQDHGYKDGSYKKLWSGREDNEHLVEAVAGLDANAPDFADALYKALAARYQQA
ncbi:dUTP diphosphatase [Simiduia agarivorans]|uniref:dUTPase family protein n=1 Tax=Simiduia agarivorans (strain DSM 21679 / JCM 13881 / BCRC 17597 / SA1) TaxID=1117647 RepID=K4KI94_SIMAS|nr:dUTP diphosphatase [Simiduia agarivorans]AFU97930.1 dUTPase family protein [Simiduia agarivorans SA1 = DSM 21679]